MSFVIHVRPPCERFFFIGKPLGDCWFSRTGFKCRKKDIAFVNVLQLKIKKENKSTLKLALV